MNNIKFVIIVLIVLFIGYAIGNLFPSSIIQGFNPNKGVPNITGTAALQVKLVNENNQPIQGIEVDVNTEPGPVPLGGRVFTNPDGIASFNILPGHYFIYFNSLTFPDNFKPAEIKQVFVELDKNNETTIVLQNK